MTTAMARSEFNLLTPCLTGSEILNFRKALRGQNADPKLGPYDAGANEAAKKSRRNIADIPRSNPTPKIPRNLLLSILFV